MGLMRKDEYSRMFKVEDELWWYKSLRDLLGYYAGRLFKPHVKILDVACGTGANMFFLNSLGYNVYGIDLSPMAINLSKKRGLKNLKIASMLKIPFSNEQFDAIVNFDALGNLPKKDVKKALSEFNRVLKKNGALITQVSALEWLRSQHDEVVGTLHRFSKDNLLNSFGKSKWRVIKLSYRFFLLFPIIATIKLLKKIQSRANAKADTEIPSINSVLFIIQKIENLLFRFISFPFGTSLFLIAKKL